MLFSRIQSLSLSLLALAPLGFPDLGYAPEFDHSFGPPNPPPGAPTWVPQTDSNGAPIPPGQSGSTSGEHTLDLDPNGTPSVQLTPNGEIYYGLWIQEVYTSAWAGDCGGGSTFQNSFTYYEYLLVTDQSPLSDTFNTGLFDSAGSDRLRGGVLKIGKSKFIPFTPEEAANFDPEKPYDTDVFLVFNQLQNDPNFNHTPNFEGNIEVLSEGQNGQPGEPEDSSPGPVGSGGEHAHSGLVPNSPTKPKGWDDDFGIKTGTRSLFRFFSMDWDYCVPPDETEEPVEEEDEDEDGDDPIEDDEDEELAARAGAADSV